jgi:hypothetical protein
MQGYDVVTIDDEKVGKVVDTQGDHLIVQTGTIRKSKHALPQTFAAIDDGEQIVRMSVTKEVFCDSPKVNGEVDETAIAEYYGLAAASEAPPTEGYGETVSDDPAFGSETHGESVGVKPATQERAESRKRMANADTAGLPDESPALLTDRLAGVEEQEQQKR